MKDIKRRIKSVKSTKQITKAMELVASSKLRHAKEKADNVRPFFDSLYELMWEISSENSTFNSIFTSTRAHHSTLVIVIAGDRGLAGGFNTNVLKLAEERCTELTKAGGIVSVLPIGMKAVEYFEKRQYKLAYKYQNIAEHLKIYGAAEIAEKIIEAYRQGKIDRVELVFTNYVSQLIQEARHMSVLPVENIGGNDKTIKAQTTYEPSPQVVFDRLIPKYVAGILYGAIVDSFASEQAARRTAMESASDNADEMIGDLELLYNRARQATITQELTEIVGGASAQA